MNNIVQILLIDKSLDLPSYATIGSSGIDLRSAVDITIHPMEISLISTGIALKLPANCEGQIRPRSGLAAKHGITVLNAPGTVDNDYRGEIKVILINLGKNDFIITRNMRIAQLVVATYLKSSIKVVESLDSTDRNDGGFGSTGSN